MADCPCVRWDPIWQVTFRSIAMGFRKVTRLHAFKLSASFFRYFESGISGIIVIPSPVLDIKLTI